MKYLGAGLLVFCCAGIGVLGQDWILSDTVHKWTGCKSVCKKNNAEFVFNDDPKDQAKMAGLVKKQSAPGAWANAYDPVMFDNGQHEEGDECSMFLVDGSEYGIVGEGCREKSPCICKGSSKCSAKPIATFLQIKINPEANLWIPDGKGAFKIVRFPQPWPGYAFNAGRYEFGDFNGDGLTDALHLWQGGSSNIWINDGKSGFKVTPDFIPFKGYDFFSGTYKVGDFTGDGRADLIHFLNKDKAYVWVATSDGKFTVKEYRPWVAYDFNAGPYFVGDYNGDGKADMIHIVSYSYANIWTSKGDGTFDVLSGYHPWEGYGMFNAKWFPGDYNGDGSTDMLHFVANLYANNWLSIGKNSFKVEKAELPWKDYTLLDGDVFTGDLNGDLKTDFSHFTTCDKKNSVVNWISTGKGDFTTIKTEVSKKESSEAYAGDFNGDGRMDLAQVVGNSQIYLWFANEKGGFEKENTFKPAQPDSVTGKFYLGNFYQEKCVL